MKKLFFFNCLFLFCIILGCAQIYRDIASRTSYKTELVRTYKFDAPIETRYKIKKIDIKEELDNFFCIAYIEESCKLRHKCIREEYRRIKEINYENPWGKVTKGEKSVLREWIETKIIKTDTLRNELNKEINNIPVTFSSNLFHFNEKIVYTDNYGKAKAKFTLSPNSKYISFVIKGFSDIKPNTENLHDGYSLYYDNKSFNISAMITNKTFEEYGGKSAGWFNDNIRVYYENEVKLYFFKFNEERNLENKKYIKNRAKDIVDDYCLNVSIFVYDDDTHLPIDVELIIEPTLDVPIPKELMSSIWDVQIFDNFENKINTIEYAVTYCPFYIYKKHIKFGNKFNFKLYKSSRSLFSIKNNYHIEAKKDRYYYLSENLKIWDKSSYNIYMKKLPIGVQIQKSGKSYIK